MKSFVISHGRLVDMQRVTLKVDLRSEQYANQFLALLKGSNHVFDISVKLSWEFNRPYLKEFQQCVANARTKIVDIDGVAVDILSQTYVEYRVDIFVDHSLCPLDLLSIALLNCPGPQKQWIYSNYGRRCRHSTLSSDPAHPDWHRLAFDLERFDNPFSAFNVTT